MAFRSMRLPWETFADQARREERERETDERWTDELLNECREHALKYASELNGEYANDVVPLRMLGMLKREIPLHMRDKVFSGIDQTKVV